MKDILIRLLSNLRKSAKSADHLFFFFFCAVCSAVAEEPFFKKNDVIALVGGEDMVAMSEYGYLELLLQRALPDYHLKFRDLAWEGDTVFEQHRDLNFPPLEAQLDQVGATVVLCQFGQMESLAGKEKLPEFIAVYEKLIARMSGGGKRKIVLFSPTPFEKGGLKGAYVADKHDNQNLIRYSTAVEELCKQRGAMFVDTTRVPIEVIDQAASPDPEHPSAWLTRDGMHLSDSEGARERIEHSMLPLAFAAKFPVSRPPLGEHLTKSQREPLRQLITAKNRLWFNYWRVQNWAFLAGDRTEQPSSRDWRDPSKRWFPAEREKFLPLIEAKEQEIWALAAKLAQP